MFHATTTNRRRLRVLGLAVALSAPVLLSGCGSDEADTAAPSEVQTAPNGDVFNGADVQFASDMIQHHSQALAMVDLTNGRELDPEVQALTEEIRAAQAPEIEQMTDWLTAWDQEVPETSRDHANAHGGGDDSGSMAEMPGMMTEDEMTALEEAPDSEFQTMWLEMMIEHHQGAVEMAGQEQENGRFEDAIALARSIESSQQAEIERMQDLLEQS